MGKTEVMKAYTAGQWDAFNRVLNLLNELEEDSVRKKVIFHKVFGLRPNENYPKD